MSQALFPTLPGVTWPVNRKPMFNTTVQRALSGRELRISYQLFPLYQYTLNLEFLRDTVAFPEADTLVGFFLARQGSSDSFLFDDVTDNSVTDMSFGAGDGASKLFQLTRAFGAGGNTFAEPVQNVHTLTNIKVAGVTQTNPTQYTIDPNGLVTFVTAPVNLATLTWSGTYYMRCRFLSDSLDMSQIYGNIWETKKLEFVGAPGNRV